MMVSLQEFWTQSGHFAGARRRHQAETGSLKKNNKSTLWIKPTSYGISAWRFKHATQAFTFLKLHNRGFTCRSVNEPIVCTLHYRRPSPVRSPSFRSAHFLHVANPPILALFFPSTGSWGAEKTKTPRKDLVLFISFKKKKKLIQTSVAATTDSEIATFFSCDGLAICCMQKLQTFLEIPEHLRLHGGKEVWNTVHGSQK